MKHIASTGLFESLLHVINEIDVEVMSSALQFDTRRAELFWINDAFEVCRCPNICPAIPSDHLRQKVVDLDRNRTSILEEDVPRKLSLPHTRYAVV